MSNAVYTGWVRHRRHSPRSHEFSYRVFMPFLDLDELPNSLDSVPLWSARRWAPGRFKREDYLGDPQLPLADAVRERVREETGQRPAGPVRMLANLRYFGFNMNPITCYYCHDRQEKLRYILVEVTNTPWKERQAYVLDCDPQRRFQRIQFDKKMHVSPFNPMDMKYRWCSNQPGKILSLNLETECSGEVHMDATLALKRREIDASSMASVLMQYPWMTASVGCSIYWQALKLWLKRNPFYDHPDSVASGPTMNRLKTKI